MAMEAVLEAHGLLAAEPESCTSTSPQQALAHLDLWTKAHKIGGVVVVAPDGKGSAECSNLPHC
jgi:hypothetical protein